MLLSPFLVHYCSSKEEIYNMNLDHILIRLIVIIMLELNMFSLEYLNGLLER